MPGFQVPTDPTQSVRVLKTHSFSSFSDASALTCSLYPPTPLYIVNLGGLLLQALLEFWPRTRINPMDEEENEVNHGENVVLNQQAFRSGGSLVAVASCQPVAGLQCFTLGVCSCLHSERRTGEPSPEGKRILPSAPTHTGNFWRSGRQNSI